MKLLFTSYISQRRQGAPHIANPFNRFKSNIIKTHAGILLPLHAVIKTGAMRDKQWTPSLLLHLTICCFKPTLFTEWFQRLPRLYSFCSTSEPEHGHISILTPKLFFFNLCYDSMFLLALFSKEFGVVYAWVPSSFILTTNLWGRLDTDWSKVIHANFLLELHNNWTCLSQSSTFIAILQQLSRIDFHYSISFAFQWVSA